MLEPWITAVVVLSLALIGGLIWLIRLEGTVKGHDGSKAESTQLARLETEVENLKAAAKEHGETRDLVIELRSDMRGLKEALGAYSETFKEAVRELGAQIKDAKRSRSSVRS